MREDDELDVYDRKILAALQADGRLANHELAERVALSPSQCSRRRRRLERAGVIGGYHARVDPARAGFGLSSFVRVTLAAHDSANAATLAELFDSLAEVQGAWALTGEADYTLRIVTPDLAALSALISARLLPHPAVQNVHTAIVLDTLKDTTALPLG